jgi:hypothetical protein
MKKFKDILSEVAQPKSAEEKRFKDQHTIELIRHPVALDSQFTGEIEGVTRKPRPSDQEGDTSYDKAYAVKNKPFKMPRNIDEESEFDAKSDKKVKKEGISFKGLLDKVVNEDAENISEDPDEEIPMMMRQLHFIGYAADEILEYLAIDDLDPEEWWQNKLAAAFMNMQSLHSYIEGDKRMMSFGNDDDMISAAYESVEETELEEATFKASNLKLKSGETVKLDMKDAKVLNDMMKTLSDKNSKEMETNLMKDKKGFEEILAFAREVLQ